jgi:hypothetical protein
MGAAVSSVGPTTWVRAGLTFGALRSLDAPVGTRAAPSAGYPPAGAFRSSRAESVAAEGAGGKRPGPAQRRSSPFGSLAAAVLALVLFATLVGGCGHKQSNANGPPPSKSTSTTSPAAPSSSMSSPTSPLSSTSSTSAAPASSTSDQATTRAPVTSEAVTSSTVTSSSPPPAGLTSTTIVPSTPPTATPPTIAPSVTAGTAVPWSPTSPDSVVGDSGNPADWPAAQAKPPSLAGAYSTNMLKVIVTLITYEDWVYSHPNPALVSNYMIAGGTTYQGERMTITNLSQRRLHANPSPTEIDWISVTVLPKPVHIQDKLAKIDGHQLYGPASVDVVIDQKTGKLLNQHGEVIGHSSVNPGRAAFAETLSQGSDGRWRIISILKLDPRGGLEALRR